MSNSYYYPPLQEGTLRALLVIKASLTTEGEDYLKDANYSEEIITHLRQLFTQPKKVRPTRNETPEALDLEVETRALYDELVDLVIENDGAMDIGDVLSSIKTRTQLLEKLLNQLERASDVKKFGQFREFVINKISAMLTADQRNEFLADLESL